MAKPKLSMVLLLFGLSSIVLIGAILWNSFMSRVMLSSSPSLKEGVIVVGSGLAGLSAASQLVSHNIPVHLLERASKPGGNSIKASSGINGAPTKYQPFPDSEFYNDTIKSAGAAMKSHVDYRTRLISTLTKSSNSAITWLSDEKGIDLSVVAQLGGHSVPRTHRGAGKTPPGAAIVTTLLNSLKANPLFKLSTDSRVIEVLRNEGKVTGVKYTSDDKSQQLNGPVVFASGGFAGDAQGMLAQYCPELAGYPSTNDAREGSQPLLTKVGAQVLDMDHVQVHPTGFVDPNDATAPVKFLAAEVLRGVGGILLYNGNRFVNEMETRIHVSNAITSLPFAETSPRQWNIQLVLDEGSYNSVKSHVDFYVWKGLMRKTTVRELGSSELAAIQLHSDAVAGRIYDPLGRKTFGHWSLFEVAPETEVYVGRVTPVVHFTMGGVMINEHSEVLDVDGNAIPGLWAAGEITGGIHGENRLGGSSLLECVVFGRMAGDQAAAYHNEIQKVKEP